VADADEKVAHGISLAVAGIGAELRPSTQAKSFR
jgi:hypothetical protein